MIRDLGQYLKRLRDCTEDELIDTILYSDEGTRGRPSRHFYVSAPREIKHAGRMVRFEVNALNFMLMELYRAIPLKPNDIQFFGYPLLPQEYTFDSNNGILRSTGRCAGEMAINLKSHENTPLATSAQEEAQTPARIAIVDAMYHGRLVYKNGHETAYIFPYPNAKFLNYDLREMSRGTNQTTALTLTAFRYSQELEAPFLLHKRFKNLK